MVTPSLEPRRSGRRQNVGLGTTYGAFVSFAGSALCGAARRSPLLSARRVTRARRRRRGVVRASTAPLPPGGGDDDMPPNEMDEWFAALEAVFEEALLSYYEGAPLFSDAEFNALRDELEHLASAQMRLGSVENVFAQATSARDFDRRLRSELKMSEDEFSALKKRMVAAHPRLVRNPRGDKPLPLRALLPKFGKGSAPPPPPRLSEAVKLDSSGRVDERIKWLLFGDATEEKLKVAMLYFPAVLMSLVFMSLLTILFAMLDGEMSIQVSQAGRVRLGVLLYLVIVFTMWFSNKVTPLMLDFLDLGQPTLLRGNCPNCSSPVSCLFTGAVRNRDERKCSVCGAIVGFNRKWSKVYLASLGEEKKYSKPD